MSVLKIKDENGDFISVRSIKGEKGDPGPQGPPGSGSSGVWESNYLDLDSSTEMIERIPAWWLKYKRFEIDITAPEGETLPSAIRVGINGYEVTVNNIGTYSWHISIELIEPFGANHAKVSVGSRTSEDAFAPVYSSDWMYYGYNSNVSSVTVVPAGTFPDGTAGVLYEYHEE